MTSKFVFMPSFNRSVKKLQKRYRHIKDDLREAIKEVELKPDIGTVIPDDYMVRKLRVASRDMKRGKSGGFRLLYWLSAEARADVVIYLLLIYSKSDISDVNLSQLKALIDDLPDEE